MYTFKHRRPALALAAALIAVPAIVVACGGSSSDPTGVFDDPKIVWGPAPAVFPAGAQMAVIQGDPGSTSEFTVRLRMPNGYVIPPHTHPTDENVTVIDGSFKVGMGTSFNEAAMVVLPRGGFVTAPAQHAHFAKAQGVTTVQVHAIGPFALTYINPNDAPK